MRIALLLAMSADVFGANWADLNRAAGQAIKANDYEKLREVLLEMRLLAPGNARIKYNLAASYAKLGDPNAAIDELQNIAAAGLIYDVNADEDFAVLRGDARFAGILSRFQENRQPLTQSSLSTALDEPDLIPESIVYDPARKRFLVASVRKAKIVLSDGKLFARAGAAVFALAIDSRRNVLWASTGYVAQCEACSKADEGRTALAAFDLVSGALRRRVESPSKGILGDMTVSRGGDLFVSNNVSGEVFRLRAEAQQFDRLVGPGELPSPQTPALSADEKTLYVPDYVRGIAAVNLATRAVTWLQPDSKIVLSGIDGLYLKGDSFMAIQNGTRPPRVVEFSRDLKRQRVLEANWPELGEPTHGEFVGDWFYFLANTGWDQKNGPPVVSTIRKLKPR